MKKLLLVLLSILIASPAFATARRTEIKNLTVGGVYVNGWWLSQTNNQLNNPAIVATSGTLNSVTAITTDAVYQTGNIGYNTLATMINATGDVSVSYQVSYDNINWWTPTVSTTAGNISSISTIDTNMATNTWIQGPWTLTPYVRFIFTNKNAGPSIITADTLWQDQS